MARPLDDIVQYFKQHGVDILATKKNLYTLCLDHCDRVYEVLQLRGYPKPDLIRSVIEAEQHALMLEEELRESWADRRRLEQQLNMALNKEESHARPIATTEGDAGVHSHKH
jgi:hypothetical protein